MIAPKQGNHLHDWILAQSRDLLVNGMTEEQIASTLVRATKHSNRTSQDIEQEIRNAIDGAKQWLADNPSYVNSRLKQPTIWKDPLDTVGLDDNMSRKDNRKEYLQLDPISRKIALVRNSNTFITREASKPGVIDINHSNLFCGTDFNICLSKTVNNSVIRPMSSWTSQDFHSAMYIVPNTFIEPGKGPEYKNDYNMMKRLYQVVEFDSGEMHEQLSILSELDNYMPLAMIVYSGRKSLHGWFACYDRSEYRIRTFFRMATKLGADRALRIPSQFTRCPNGYNYKTNKRQAVIYYDENVIESQTKLVGQDLWD